MGHERAQVVHVEPQRQRPAITSRTGDVAVSSVSSRMLTPTAMMQLQRLAGNRAVLQVMQARASSPATVQRNGGDGDDKKGDDKKGDDKKDEKKPSTGERFRRAGKRAQARNKKRQSWPGSSMRREGEFGPVGISKGRGRQPIINTRETEYEKAKVGTHYGHKPGKSTGFAKHLASLSTEDQKAAARALHNASKGRPIAASDMKRFDVKTKRALAFFHHVVHQAEEDPTRNPGSAKLARGGLDAIQKEKKTFSSFYGDASPFLPAQSGGTGLTRDVIGGEEAPEELKDFEDEMSESSDEDDTTVGDYFKQFKDYKDPDNDPGGAGMAVS
jgi:hypothetical protein